MDKFFILSKKKKNQKKQKKKPKNNQKKGKYNSVFSTCPLQCWTQAQSTESTATVHITLTREKHPATNVYTTLTQLNTRLFFFLSYLYLNFNIESQRMKIKVAFPSKSDYASSSFLPTTNSSYKFDFLSHLHFS